MSVRVASWNIEGRLSRYSKTGRGTPEQILREIESLNADVLFLPEAYGDNPFPGAHIDDAFHAMGYEIRDVSYEDRGRCPSDDVAVFRPSMRLASRLAMSSFERIRLGDLRNAITCHVDDPDSQKTLRIIGIHLDDRSEELRQRQLTDLVPIINNSDLPTVMMGDYNAMHGETHRARLVRSTFARWMAHNLLLGDSLRDFVVRATDMATGTTLSVIESETNLNDANLTRQPTTTPKVRQHPWLPSIRLLDIDHIMVSEDVAVEDFRVGAYDMGSDHRPISARISL